MPHYFDPEPDAASAPRRIEVRLGDLSFSMQTDRGVFAHGRVDRGTHLLLARAPRPPESSQLVDVGCGAGVIALTMAQRAPTSTIWAIDVNERARRLCRLNAEQLGLGNVRVAHPDEVDPHLRFAALWSNPPIRIGKHSLHELLQRWLGRLEPDGVAWLVVQRNLGADSLERWLGQRGHRTERTASRSGYRLLSVRPGSGPLERSHPGGIDRNPET
jgi:16S rRNA (guanine1207-N2)-methyltransferase